MGLIKKKPSGDIALAVQTREKELYQYPPTYFDRALYKSLKESVPIISASIGKICRLIGDFEVKCQNDADSYELTKFLKTVKVGAMGQGIHCFIATYLEDLLTYGTAIGEIILKDHVPYALYNASLDSIELKEVSPLNVQVSLISTGRKLPCRYPELLLMSALNPPSGKIMGVSILEGLPFVSDILLKIYKTMGKNWDRVGNVRFAVTAKSDDSVYAPEKAKNIAKEWQKAMRSNEINDFVAVGDVNIKAIGADNQILDSNIPVRQMLEQIVAKIGLPPFLLGLSWSSTERMSSQQADILTSELEAYRRLLEPVLMKICTMWLRLCGKDEELEIIWDDISLQDEVDHSVARLNNARAKDLEVKAYELSNQTGGN